MLELLAKVIGDANKRKIDAVRPLVVRVNSLEAEIQAKSDEELRAMTPAFRERLANGERLDALLPEAYAVVREAGRRVLNMRHFDVQIIGGIFLHRGQIAEMRTGEGKTLVATLPSYLNALPGKGVHVVTVNDYLAKRDSEWMGQIHRYLGMEVGIIQHHLNPMQRRGAYAADITYATNNELGFDYLRDNMAQSIEDCVQRKLNYAIVDEVDSILIDEARTPLIISGQIEQKQEQYLKLAKATPRLIRDVDYTVDEKAKNISMNEEGIEHAEKLLGVRELYDPQNPSLAHDLVNALKAKELYRRDVEYVVKNNPETGIDEVVIVDEFTGRLMPGRRWSDGLHQSVEAKEAVHIQDETQTLATITFQNFFRMYGKLAGMTGTAATEEAEFGKIYNLEVAVIPTNRPMIRKDLPDTVYKTVEIKFQKVADEIEELHRIGRPVLVGTVSIEKSEALSAILKLRGVPHTVLNAKFHEQEARIVAQAGRVGAVTIATNMAGRGTDIILGGNPEGLVNDLLLAKGHATPFEAPVEELKAAREHAYKQWEVDREKVVSVGGLHIIGTERHESRRIDNQLRGRAGRQGDPGSSRFYLALDDDLMRLFGGDRIARMMERLQVPDDEAIEHGLVTRAIENAQRKVEVYHFNIRKQVLEYDDVMNKQREIIYAERRKVLEGADMRENLVEMIRRTAEHLTLQFVNPGLHRDEWDLAGLLGAVGGLSPLLARNLTMEELDGRQAEDLKAYLFEQIKMAYEAKEETVGPEMMRQLERFLMLRIIDQYWIQHLHDMDALREGIGLRAYGQKDPLQEYKREAFETFQDLLRAIQHDLVAQVFHVQVVYDVPPPALPVHHMRMSAHDFEEDLPDAPSQRA
ncbi:MAG: preprotein translocase subunit SecA [Candidatus Sericytochromatia bacterium]|nr:preprotein translocase subunit SecA [Candidatus Tanganyikabacteria bacterium]